MAKGKTTNVAWRCPDCNMIGKTGAYTKSKKAAMELSRFCRKCRKHTVQKPKDQKKSS